MNIEKVKINENLRELAQKHNFFELFYLFNRFTIKNLAIFFKIDEHILRNIKSEFDITAQNKLNETQIYKDFNEKFNIDLKNDINLILNDKYINDEVKFKVKLTKELLYDQLLNKNKTGFKFVTKHNEGFVYVSPKKFINENGKEQLTLYATTLDKLEEKVKNNNLLWKKVNKLNLTE